MSNVVIAIDGPSASGKSTVARIVASRLGYVFVDSGSFYRGLTWKVLEEKAKVDDANGLAAILEKIKVEFYTHEGSARFRIDGKNVDEKLRTRVIDENVSAVSAVSIVRSKVVSWLRGLIKFGNLVMEGRDIGTAVFPDAKFKFYLDADPEERARRRHAEIGCRLLQRDGMERNKSSAGDATGGKKIGFDEIKATLERRDAIDKGRKMDPLKIAKGAVVIDSTHMSIDEVVEFIIDRIEN